MHDILSTLCKHHQLSLTPSRLPHATALEVRHASKCTSDRGSDLGSAIESAVPRVVCPRKQMRWSETIAKWLVDILTSQRLNARFRANLQASLFLIRALLMMTTPTQLCWAGLWFTIACATFACLWFACSSRTLSCLPVFDTSTTLKTSP